MTGLVRGDGDAVGLRVDDRLLEPQLLGQLGLVDVVRIHLTPAVAEGHEQRLVEEVLEHDRRVAEGVVREALADLVLVQLRGVRLALEEEVDQVAALVLRRHVEVQAAVEPAGPAGAVSSWSARFVAAMSRMLL